MLMKHQHAAELTQPDIGSLNDPTSFVEPHFVSIFIAA